MTTSGVGVVKAEKPSPIDQDVTYAQDPAHDGSLTNSGSPTRVRILKSDVIGNIHCQLSPGYGAARHLGVVKVPRGEQMDFAVLAQSGTRFSGSLPFHPNHTHIGAGSDGSAIVGFGALRRNSGKFRPPDSPEPIRILRDNKSIFDSPKAWDFDVADDGSSFYVHEPDADGTSRLIIRDLKGGHETEYDLSTKFTPKNAYEGDYWLRYSIDFTEVYFEPAYADARGIGEYRFFPINYGKPRRISTETAYSAILSSSTNGYFVDPPEQTGSRVQTQSWTIYRKELNHTSNTENVIWQRTIDLDHFSGGMRLSRNGKWLGLSAWEYIVLSADTGSTRFRFRTVNNIQHEFDRLRPVLPDNATASEVGARNAEFFLDDFLVISRRVGTLRACANKPGQPYDPITYRMCIREQRLFGRYHRFHDVFNMNEVSVRGGPISRREVFQDTPCSNANSPLPGLIVNNGVLAYGIAEEYQGL